MIMLDFHKMHGLGNDFIVIDGRDNAVEMTPARAAALSDRKAGIGCDQLILLENSQIADVKMRIFNADGGEVGACGNASRCIVKFLGNAVQIETAGGIISGELDGDVVAMNMGKPRFGWDEIPLAYAMDSENMPVAWENLQNPSCVNVGNPHVVFVVEDSSTVDLTTLGPVIENDPLFPERVNVNVASVSGGQINLRVWERGVGETRACGTGACATAVALIRQKKITSPVTVNLQGGSLNIAWQDGSDIQMTGDGVHVFTGQIDLVNFG